jgi:L-ascorbate metabolism protein UlaG (beta-lactamase superfamily)
MSSIKRWLLACAGVLALTGALAQDKGTSVLWLGQAAFKIVSPGGKVIVVDPWLRGNPTSPAQYKQLEALGKVDALLVTHGHLDHFADAPDLAKMHNVPMYAPGDMNSTVVALGILPANLAPRFNKTGTVEPVPGIKVTAVHAEHSSVIVWKNPATNKDEAHVGGEPVGFIIEMEDGFKVYHMGDTGLFGDMKFIAQYYKPDVVLMPIGGNFTMGPADAAYAAKELLGISSVIPMHYGANPLAKGKVSDFLDLMKGAVGIRVLPLKPGETARFAGK